MVDNSIRADWAGAALQAFADESMDGVISDEAVMDLLCDLGHYAERVLSLTENEIIGLFRIGIGAWKAESEHPIGDPHSNKMVDICILE
ncbi:MAG: hypothetical protein Q8L53_15975 [Aestuariivirga sp.]|nr:hypothetical protein [Aestuariivirga sp.]